MRAIKEVGWQGFSVDNALTPLSNMGQLLFEPPNVAGWPLGADWFSTGAMLARMNFAATLASNQKEFLAADAGSRQASTPQALLAAMLDRVTPAPLDAAPQQALMVVPASPAARGPAATRSSAPRPPGSRTCWSAPPSTSSCRGTTMNISRRQFIRDGVAAFTLGFAAPAFLDRDRARAGHPGARGLVVLYLSGGNDALSTLVPYRTPFYYSRRPTIAVPAGQVLQIGTDSAGRALGLHPRLAGLKNIFNEGRLALIQRTGYAELEPVALRGTRHLVHRQPADRRPGSGWLGRYLDTLPSPVDPLAGWNTTGETPHALQSALTRRARDSERRRPTRSRARTAARQRCRSAPPRRRIASQPGGRPAAPRVREQHQPRRRSRRSIASRRRRRTTPTVTYPNNGFAQALRTVAGAIVRGIGTKVFWVQTGGFDTHAQQDASGGGAYANLMATLNDGADRVLQRPAQPGAARTTRS